MILTKIRETASQHAGIVAVQIKQGDGYRRYTYADLIRAVASLCFGLSKLGIGKADRVAILSENRPEWIFAYLAVTSLGAVAVPLDAQLTDKEVAVLLADSGAKAVCVSAGTRSKLPRPGGAMVISFDSCDDVSFTDLMKAHPLAPLPPAPSGGDLAAILYTSGTTGDPKGVMLSHGNLVSNCESLAALDLFHAGDNFLCILPYHHTYPAMGCIVLPLSAGATVTILNSLKGPDIVAAMQETGVSIVVAVPQLLAGLRRAVFEGIGKNPLLLRLLAKLFLLVNGMLVKFFRVNMGTHLFHKVHAKFGIHFRLFASGGARLDPDVYTDMTNLGFSIIEGYGLTETAPCCTFNPLGKQKPGSIGVPVPNVEVRIVNPDEQGRGEIAVAGPNVMLGYYKKPEATAEVMRDGWFFTGDLGYKDRDGYFFITGRSKEMIVLSTGKKIFPDELEKFYQQLPSIKEICMLQTGRGLEAAVVPDFEYLRKMNIANARETISFGIADLAKDLAPHKRISGLKVFKESLPVTRLGKLRRAKVRELYLTGGERVEKAAREEDSGLLETDTGKKAAACILEFSVKKRLVPDDNLEIDLGLDSLSRVELVVSLERTFGVGLPDSFGSSVFTVRDVVERMDERLAAGTAGPAGHVRLTWGEILAQEPGDEAKRLARLRRNPLCVAGWAAGLYFLRHFFRVYGRMTVRGTENLPKKGPYLLTPNHLSNADAFLQAVALPVPIARQVFYLGDTRFFGGPVSSRIARYMQVIPVDMETKLYNALQLSAFMLRQGKILCVFPEGARSRDGNIKEFKKGVGILAKELNVPLVPVALTGTYEMLRPGKNFPRPAKVSVAFGKPVYPGTMAYEEIVQKLYEEVVGMMEPRSGSR